MDKNIPYHLMAAAFEGTLSSGEKAELEVWLSENEANAKLYEEMKGIWNQSGTLSQVFSPDPFAALSRVHQRIGFAQEKKSIPLSKFSKSSFYIKIAASVILVLGFYFLFRTFTQVGTLTAYTTPNTNQELILPDKSEVTLNRNSTLTYPEKFTGNERRLKLSGEALFKVTSDKSKPFIIEAGKTQTCVLGTRFNLMAYDNSDSTVINLLEGKVEFSTIDGKEKITLLAGEKAVYIKSSASLLKMKETSANVTSWHNGLLVFENTCLKDVCSDLNQMYGVNFSFEDTSLTSLRFNGRFEKQKLSVVIKSIEEAMNLTAKVDNGNIVFKNH